MKGSLKFSRTERVFLKTRKKMTSLNKTGSEEIESFENPGVVKLKVLTYREKSHACF